MNARMDHIVELAQLLEGTSDLAEGERYEINTQDLDGKWHDRVRIAYFDGDNWDHLVTVRPANTKSIAVVTLGPEDVERAMRHLTLAREIVQLIRG